MDHAPTTQIMKRLPITAPPPAPDSPMLAAGTHLLTPSGWQPIEDLHVGDTLLTATGRQRKLCRAEWHDINCRRHPAPETVMPIRICAGAFGPDLPRCDVLLAPDQTIFIENVLIPARLLANGATIRRETVAATRYFKLSLPTQDVIIADGLPVGSHPDMRHRDPGGGPAYRADPAPLAPLAVSGPMLRRSRAHLIARADSLDYRMTQDPDLHLRADGTRIWGRLANSIWSGWVPRGVQELHILSRASAPADCHPDSDDHRPLGVALRGITLHAGTTRRHLTLADPDWGTGTHPPESQNHTSWRWTNGAATLPPALWDGIDSDFRLDLHVARTQTYRLAEPDNLAALSEENWLEN